MIASVIMVPTPSAKPRGNSKSAGPIQASDIIISPYVLYESKSLAPVAIAAAAILKLKRLPPAQDFKVLNGCDLVNGKSGAN
jgi:hypothetical protein